MGSSGAMEYCAVTVTPGKASPGPPRARLSFRVGVVGHRPNRLPSDPERLAMLRQTLHAILAQVRQTMRTLAAGPDAPLYAQDTPILRALSPLAEGSDRIFAEEALALGYELCCPMPFFQDEFEKDFAGGAALEPDSLTHFHSLLAQADSGPGLALFEMDGGRTDAPQAYGAAGRIVLNQSDLLIGVWDGGEPAGRGGTLDTLREAIQYHVPVIWIDATAPDAWRLLRTPEELTIRPVAGQTHQQLHDAVFHVVATELAMPKNSETEGGSRAPDYFAEQKPSINLFFIWKAFRDLVSGALPSPWPLFPADFETQIRGEWPVVEDGGTAPSPVSDWINKRLRRHFAWADGLADYYADAHRSAFVLSYLLAALAVFTALLPMAANRRGFFEMFCTLAEMVSLAGVFLLLKVGRKRRWHERWAEYRLLAELIRQLRFLIPLGGGKPSPRMPAHLAVYGDPARTWMYWYVRAIAREIGIPSARVTQAYMHDCLGFLAQVVGDPHAGQWGFHLVTERRAQRLNERLRKAVLFLVGATFLGVSTRLMFEIIPAGSGYISAAADRWLVLAAATLPALGAALEGINNQGEFVRVAKRSMAMASIFEKYSEKITLAEKTPPLLLAELIPLSGRIAESMVDEVVDWRAVIIDRA